MGFILLLLFYLIKYSSSTCQDKGNSCYKIEKLCTNLAYYDLMTDLCPKTCFRCPGPDSDTFNTPSCQDRDVSCRAKKRLCRSTNKSVSGRIKKQCPKTCNLCDSSGVEEDTSCENKQIECHSIKFLCKSRNKGYLKFMRKHCPSTCSLCKELENDEEEAGCSDVDKNCQEKLDLCDHPTFSKAMNKDCKASCSVC